MVERAIGGVTLAIVLVACGTSVPGPATPVPAGPTPSAAPSSVAPSPSGPPEIAAGEPWLAVQANTAAGYGVHLVRPDGTGLHRWPAGVPGTHEHPDWSPTGDRILLNTVTADGTEDLWIGNADGTDAHVLLDCVDPCVWVDEAAWSPDGMTIAFQRLVVDADDHLVSTLELLDVETGATSVVLTMPRQEVVLAPRWSPDGRRIAVEVIHLPADRLDVDPDSGGIGVVDLDEAQPAVRPITERDFSNSPDWSPDGDWVSLSRPRADGGADVWVVRPDGTDARRVTDLAPSGAAAEQPAFTPDGAAILFVWTEGGRSIVGRIAVDGTGLGSATGDLELRGTHPRLRPTP